MQKKLIALAVAGLASGAAFAQSNVTMYGIVDAAVVNASATGKHSQTMVTSSGLSGSRLGVKGVEDLGGGLKVVANLEYALDVMSNSSIGNARQEMLALAGGFGTVAAGYLQTAGYDFGVKYDVTAGSSVSPLQNITNANGFYIGASAAASRANNAIAYISPNMGGVTVALNRATLASNLNVASATADAEVTANLLSANYDNGPLSLGAVYLTTATPNTANTAAVNVDRKEWSLGASYNLGAATLKGTYQSGSNSKNAGNTDANAATNKVWSLGAVIPAGPGAVVASYAKSSIGTVANSDADGYTLGYLYSLSKRSTVYGAYSHMSNSSAGTVGVVNNGVTPTVGGTGSLLALGLKHTF